MVTYYGSDVLLAATLYLNLKKAKLLLDQKRDAFITLSELYASKVSIWNKQDRDARKVDSDKEVVCVYRQSQKKGQFIKSTYIYYKDYYCVDCSSVALKHLPYAYGRTG